MAEAPVANTIPVNPVPAKKGLDKTAKLVIGIVVGFVVALIGLVIMFGSPSAESVFKDMNEEMLKTRTVTLTEVLSLSGADGSQTDFNSKLYMNMSSTETLVANGEFRLSITGIESPLTVKAEVVSVNDENYIRYSELSSPSPELAPSFSEMEANLKGEWIKVRDGDQFGSLAKTPIEFVASPLPVPFANLSDSPRKDVLSILRDKSTYTIEESSKVDIGDVSAYKYQISFNQDQYDRAAKAIANYVKYFKTTDDNGGHISSMTVWVDSSTKRIVKMEFEGTSDQGVVSGSISFSEYGAIKLVEKPSNYFVESELLN